MSSNYERANAEAATRQGLDPVRRALRAKGIPVQIENTGGFTMVAVVPSHDGKIGISEGERDRRYLTVFYEGRAWDNGELGTETLTENGNLEPDGRSSSSETRRALTKQAPDR